MKTSKIDRDFRRFKNFISEGFPEKLKNEITENKKIKNTFDTYLSYLDNISSNDLYKLEILYFDYLCSISNLPIELLFIEYPLDLPYRYKNYLKNRGIDPNEEYDNHIEEILSEFGKNNHERYENIESRTDSWQKIKISTLAFLIDISLESRSKDIFENYKINCN